MDYHHHARLTIYSREQLARDVMEGRLSLREVAAALEKREFQKAPWSPSWTALEHAQRIAWLVERGWEDAIQIDVGVRGYLTYLPHDLMTDGNHRLAAAIFRKDAAILADVSGCLDYALELFGVEV
jgi:hypothetical protein